MSNIIDIIEAEGMKKSVDDFRVGDTVKVHIKFKVITRAGVDPSKSKNVRQDKSVKEEIKTQVFEGLVIARKNGSLRETFTVRKISYGVGVEKTWMLHSPQIDSIEIVRKGKVRRAKLYYIRTRRGKAAKIKDAVSKVATAKVAAGKIAK